MLIPDALFEWAAELATDYNSSVYLCGSALHKETPRDVDVRITLTDQQFEERYKGTAQLWISGLETGEWADVNWNQSNDCVAGTKQGWKKTGLNIDMQVYPQSYAIRYAHLPRLVLSTRVEAPSKDGITAR